MVKIIIYNLSNPKKFNRIGNKIKVRIIDKVNL